MPKFVRKSHVDRKWEVADFLVGWGACSVSDIARQSGVSKTQARNILERMVRDGLLFRLVVSGSSSLGRIEYFPTIEFRRIMDGRYRVSDDSASNGEWVF